MPDTNIKPFQDLLYEEMHESIQDNSTPLKTKQTLLQYYQSRLKQLKTLKQKQLQRWAHFALTSKQLE